MEDWPEILLLWRKKKKSNRLRISPFLFQVQNVRYMQGIPIVNVCFVIRTKIDFKWNYLCRISNLLNRDVCCH